MAASLGSKLGELRDGVLHLPATLNRFSLDNLKLLALELTAVDGSRLEVLDSAGVALLVYLQRRNPALELRHMPETFHKLSRLYEIDFANLI